MGGEGVCAWGEWVRDGVCGWYVDGARVGG